MYRRGPSLPLVTVHPLRPHQDNPILTLDNGSSPRPSNGHALARVHRNPASYLRPLPPTQNGTLHSLNGVGLPQQTGQGTHHQQQNFTHNLLIHQGGAGPTRAHAAPLPRVSPASATLLRVAQDERNNNDSTNNNNNTTCKLLLEPVRFDDYR